MNFLHEITLNNPKRNIFEPDNSKLTRIEIHDFRNSKTNLDKN